MSRWLRFYCDALDDPKVQRLPADVFKGWVNLLCLAGRHDGKLPSVGDIAFALRISEREAESLVTVLLDAGLLDDVGGHTEPHNWAGRQYKADPTAPERMRKYRERKRAVTDVTRNGDVTPVTRDGLLRPVEQSRTDTEADISPTARPKRVRTIATEAFGKFWEAYPSDANMSKKEAAAAFDALTADDQSKAIEAVTAFKAYCAKHPDYRPVHAVRFLRQRRFDGFAGEPSKAGEVVPFKTEEEFQTWWRERAAKGSVQ